MRLSIASTTLPADGSTKQLVPLVSGAKNPALVWSVTPAIGTISNTGLYTAPTAATERRAVTVTVTSVEDQSKSATASITLAPVPADLRKLNADSLSAAIAALRQLPDCGDCDSLLKSTVPGMLPVFDSTVPAKTPLTGARCDPLESSFAFTVDPPFTSTQNLNIGFDLGGKTLATNGRLLTGAQVSNWVRQHYEGRFWIQKEITDHFTTLYADVGLTPLVVVKPHGPRTITIRESWRAGRIIFPDDKGNSDTDKLAYLLLDDEDFAAYEKPALHLHPLNSPIQGFVLCLPELRGQFCDADAQPSGDIEQTELEYLDSLRLGDLQSDLQGIGYSVTPTGGAGGSSKPVDLLIQKLTGPGKSQPTNTPSAPSAGGGSSGQPSATAEPRSGSAPSVMNRNSDAGIPERSGASVRGTGTAKTTLGGEPSLDSRGVPAVDPDRPPLPAFLRGEYAVGVQYRPGQAVRFLGSVQGARFALGGSNGSLAGQIGTDGAHVVGKADVNLDYLWFAQLGRRLAFSIQASSDATAQRVLGGVLADERRTGGRAHVELDIFRNRGGALLRLTSDLRRETVTLTPQSGGPFSFNLSTIEPGAQLFYGSAAALHPTRLLAAAHVKVGLGLGAAEPTYRVATLETGLHQRVSNAELVSVDVFGRFQWASGATPIFELPALGGADSLRGFRADDALGRRLWTVQSELWAPVPGTLTAQPGEGVRGFLRKQIRLAGFFDVGGVADTRLNTSLGGQVLAASVSSPGLRYGPGLGVRFLRGSIALKLDWGYGFGRGASGAGRGRFYIGITRAGGF